jgi:hypothetical protein
MDLLAVPVESNLFEDGYGNVRTDFGAESTAGAKVLIKSLRRLVSLDVDLVAQRDQLLWAGEGADTAPFASQLIYLDSCHYE